MLKHCIKIFLVFFICATAHVAKAQWVTIPDSNFVNFLTDNYPSCMNGNLMDTTCSAVVNATTVNCNTKNIYDLEGIQYFDSLKSLNCSYNNFQSLPPLPSGLTDLRCSNVLTSIPDLPAGLVYLDLSEIGLTSLPALPAGLVYLDLLWSGLTSLPPLPVGLEHFDCRGSQIVNFPLLPTTLKYFDFSANHALDSFPSLPNGLRILTCSECLLDSIPPLPLSLTSLWCFSNQLTNLPVLPSGLIGLDCSNNLLTYLPSLPSNLTYLQCGNNPLLSFPASLPSGLIQLGCAYDQLTSLPPLPSGLSYLDCSSNPLTNLPDLPSSMGGLSINNIPSLHCLPPINYIGDFIWNGTPLTCLPNAITIGSSATPSIANLPLCQPWDVCTFNWKQYGNVYQDANLNCQHDTNELHLKNLPIQLDSSGNQLQLFITNNEGYYSFQTGLGNYELKIDTTGLPFDVLCPATGMYNSVLTAIDSLDADLDFGLRCKTGYVDLLAKSIAASAPLQPGAQRTLYLNAGDATLFYGVTCATGLSGEVQAVLSGVASYLSAAAGALTPTNVNGDTLTWSIPDFSVINPATAFNIHVQIDSSATTSDTVCVQLSVSVSGTDNVPNNNSLSTCFSIVNSFDPNAKEMYPSGFADTTKHEFTFTIYFQNTGNAVAENIYITDTLENDLDAGTFKFLSSSHDVVTQLLPGNVLRFSFPNINLPDSTSNEPQSHGYVQFKVNRKDTVYENLIITNTAHIFFDLNAPVATNETYAVLNFDCNDLLSVTTDTAICSNELLTATNNIHFPFPVNYEWLLDGASVSNTATLTLNNVSAGVHPLTLNVSAGTCAVSHTQQVTVFALPQQPAINVNGDTLTTTTAATYQWFFNGTVINGATQNNYVLAQSGWYSVGIADANGCSAMSDSVYVSAVGINEYANAYTQCYVYPNPVTEDLYIQTITQPGTYLHIELTDMTGRKLQTIFTGKVETHISKYNVNMSSFAKGVYVLRVNDKVMRVVVE